MAFFIEQKATLPYFYCTQIKTAKMLLSLTVDNKSLNAVMRKFKKFILARKNLAISGFCAKYLITELVHDEPTKDKTPGELHVC
jgi:hypothetical protein